MLVYTTHQAVREMASALTDGGANGDEALVEKFDHLFSSRTAAPDMALGRANARDRQAARYGRRGPRFRSLMPSPHMRLAPRWTTTSPRTTSLAPTPRAGFVDEAPLRLRLLLQVLLDRLANACAEPEGLRR